MMMFSENTFSRLLGQFFGQRFKIIFDVNNNQQIYKYNTRGVNRSVIKNLPELTLANMAKKAIADRA